MATVYFPSCKFKAGYPETAEKVAEYIRQRFGFTLAGCCRAHLGSLEEHDTTVCICNTCTIFCDESAKTQNIISIWEVLAQDAEFPFPDYNGEPIALQDCWRAGDKRPVQDAVRELLQKMNLRVLELHDNYAQSRFCGTSVL